MSTNDVPGYRPENNDELAMGCWAEHKDGSLVFVESTEGSRVIYSIFDMAKDKPVEYRDAMPEASFKTTFSWDPDDPDDEKWTWHDKTPFPWDKLIKHGVSDGPRSPSAEHTLNAAESIMRSRERHVTEREETAAERVARRLRLRGEELDQENIDHRHDTVLSKVTDVMSRLTDAIDRLDRRPRR